MRRSNFALRVPPTLLAETGCHAAARQRGCHAQGSRPLAMRPETTLGKVTCRRMHHTSCKISLLAPSAAFFLVLFFFVAPGLGQEAEEHHALFRRQRIATPY
jgi:hypothetical protein